MLYECAECEHKLAYDAHHCPNCGTTGRSNMGAGYEAWVHYEDGKRRKIESERDKTDPGWREQEERERKLASEAKEAQERLSKENCRDLFRAIWFIIITICLVGNCIVHPEQLLYPLMRLFGK
jgi:hypothetical protein